MTGLPSDVIALIIFGAVVVCLIFVGIYASRIDKEAQKRNINAINRLFIKNTVETITDVLSDHPSLPASTNIEGSSADGKGRVFNGTSEYNFRITPPTREVFNRTAGLKVEEPATNAVLTIKGTIKNYDIVVSGAGKRLVFSSRSNQVIEF